MQTPYQPAGDQPAAIAKLSAGLGNNMPAQTLEGVTGSGKTYTMANVIAKAGRPAMVMSHNKTLAAQLYAEFRTFFPAGAVEYFVSYYDYYQPEAYVPQRDLYIEKDSDINKHIEQLRLSATKAIMERRDCIIVATVSAIYGIGDPVSYHGMILHLQAGEETSRESVIKRLTAMQYTRGAADFARGVFRVRGDIIDIFPAENADSALRAEFDGGRIESLFEFDPLTGRKRRRLARYTVYPSSHYVVPPDTVARATKAIRAELEQRLGELNGRGEAYKAERLRERTLFDLEMLEATGMCKGIENYSRHFSGREPGEPPPTLFDYLPADALLFIDESHVTVPQIGAMHKGDRSRKTTLVQHGFRLPSALDNRPLMFGEFEKQSPQTIFVSATPGKYEGEKQMQLVRQIVRPTGLLDPKVEVRPAQTQVEDLLGEIKLRRQKKERVLVGTLTKRMAEKFTDYLGENGVKARYMHADTDTVERADILRDLRLGVFDVLVGINLLREGLDLPEVSLVAVFDADREGFLRSETSLVQTIGRAARHINGTAILYADNRTRSIDAAMRITDERRKLQTAHNKKHNISPAGIKKAVMTLIDIGDDEPAKAKGRKKTGKAMTEAEAGRELRRLEKKMLHHARNLEFEQAAAARDEIRIIRREVLGASD